jgi:hypothetical protein
MNKYESIWWSIEVASGWLVDENPECITFRRKDGVGALQISAYKHESGIVPVDDVRDLIRDELPDEAILQQVICGEFIGSGLEYVEEGKFRLKRWLRSGPVLLYVTYNSNAEDCSLEMDDVNRVITTLKRR